MKNYTITVNGNVYDVTVEEGTGSTAGAAKAATPKAAAPKAAPKAAAPAGAQGAVKVNAPMPGKILKVNVNAGTAVKKGDVLPSLFKEVISESCSIVCAICSMGTFFALSEVYRTARYAIRKRTNAPLIKICK